MNSYEFLTKSLFVDRFIHSLPLRLLSLSFSRALSPMNEPAPLPIAVGLPPRRPPDPAACRGIGRGRLPVRARLPYHSQRAAHTCDHTCSGPPSSLLDGPCWRKCARVRLPSFLLSLGMSHL